MYAIAGVTGHTGSVAAETLLAEGKPVRVIVRDAAKGVAWMRKGAEVAVASLDDVPALTAALTGVAGAFVLLPPQAAITSPTPSRATRTDTVRHMWWSRQIRRFAPRRTGLAHSF
jgi:uncharacterized protein YbjT (DUF2867 family)